MASTTNDDGFHEIQLNGKQLVFLFMAVTVVAVVIFLCGVLVGRGVRTERAGDEPTPAGAVDTVAAAQDVPPASASASGNPPATANENLSYPNRLGTAQPPAEQLRQTPPRPAAAPPAEPARAPAPAAAAADPPTGEPAGSGYAIQVTALRQRAEADNIARRLSGKGYPAYVVAPAEGAPSMFRVRVGKFKDRREAESAKARLEKEEQFKPWIVP